MARRKKSGLAFTKKHAFGSLVIVLAGIFAVGGIFLNSSFVLSGSGTNLAGQTTTSGELLGIFECAYDSYAGAVLCGPEIDRSNFENVIQIYSTDVIGIRFDGTPVEYDGSYFVLSCSEIETGCDAGYEASCQLASLCAPL
ncbi:MAG: hypothetical protein HY513_01600 [Candidatus Aenigmarchaeota archaeon]|nr:hypothetical protein [Candidatus Aenigmarchaeota archaeon]